jgi:hypothetical protein
LAIGAPRDNGVAGAVYIYTRQQNGNWALQAHLIGDQPAPTGSFLGLSMSLSSNGNILAVGAPNENIDRGAVYVYTRNSHGAWSLTQSISPNIPGAQFGDSVTLSADNSTLAIGAPQVNNSTGAVYVYTNQNGTWVQQGNPLVGTGSIATVYQGASVSLSSDGNTLAVGAPGAANNPGDQNGFFQSPGIVYIFNRNNGAWSQDQNPQQLFGTPTGINANQGSSVSLSSDGRTLLFGSPVEQDSAGAAYIFSEINGTWTQTARLIAPGTYEQNGFNGGNSLQGHSVYLSSDGNTFF